MKKRLFSIITALALWQARCQPPAYLYPEYRDYDALVEQYAEAPCVYFTDNYFAPLTQDVLQLLHFKDFYVTDENGYLDMLDYLEGSEQFVAYVDISEYWSSGYDPEEIIGNIRENTEYTQAELLYQNGLSATYVIAK